MLNDSKYDSQPDKYFQELMSDIFIMAKYARELGKDIPEKLQHSMAELFKRNEKTKGISSINNKMEIEK